MKAGAGANGSASSADAGFTTVASYDLTGAWGSVDVPMHGLQSAAS